MESSRRRAGARAGACGSASVHGARGLLAAVVCAMCCAAAFALSGCQQLPSTPEAQTSSMLNSNATVSSGTLTVGVNASKSPYAGTTANGELVGLDVDLAAALADALGLKVKVVDVKDEGVKKLEAKEVDVVLGMAKTAGNDAISYSKTYLNDGSALFMTKDKAKSDVASVDFANLGDKKVLVQSSSAAATEVQEALGLASTSAVATVKDGLDALGAGTSDYFVADAAAGDYFARDYDNIVNVGFLSSTSVRPVYAATLSSSSELSSAVGKAVDTFVSDGTVRLFVDKWLGTQGESLLPGKTDMSTLPDTFTGATQQAQAETQAQAQTQTQTQTQDQSQMQD